MQKQDELTHPNSCIGKALDDEWVFVLLERDIASVAAVRAWIGMRISSGKNKFDDPQITEAHKWVATVEASLANPERQAFLRKGKQAPSDINTSSRYSPAGLAPLSRQAKQQLCPHTHKQETVRFAFHGKWYQRSMCRDCDGLFDVFIRDVDQKNDADCEAADRSQGIV